MYSGRTIEVVAVSVFLLGSGLCGLAGEFGPLALLGDGMSQFVVFRAVQGRGEAVCVDLHPPQPHAAARPRAARQAFLCRPCC